MPQNRDPIQTDVKEETKPGLGFDLKSLAANAARAALTQKAQQVAVLPLLDQMREEAEPELPNPQNAQPRGNEQPREEPWVPPGNTASRAQTEAAFRRVQGRLAEVTKGIAPNIDAIFEDEDAVRRDIAAAMRGRRRAEEVEAIAGQRQDILARPPGQDLVAGQPQPPNVLAVRPEVEVRQENALAVQNREVAQPLPIHPDWHAVVNLPGYHQQATRIVARAAFEDTLNTSLESMHMICDLLNPHHHVQAVAQWIAKNAQEVDASKIDFNKTFPGFSAEFKAFQDKTTTYIVTADVGGHYIYIRQGGLEQNPAIARDVNRPAIEAPRGRQPRNRGVEL